MKNASQWETLIIVGWWRWGRVDLYPKHGLMVLVAIRYAGTVKKAWMRQSVQHECRYPS